MQSLGPLEISFLSIIIILFLLIYFLPTLLAFKKKNNIFVVFIINILLGWTIVGWFLALYFSFKKDHSRI
jgi:hypothetical protein